MTLLYFLLPHKLRWIWLLITSYFFYMSWNPQYALLMATSTLLTYLSGLLIAHSNKIHDEKKRIFRRKLWVALSFSSNLAILLFFKYFGFIIVNINKIIGIVGLRALTPSFDVLLPVGISFYTFQALATPLMSIVVKLKRKGTFSNMRCSFLSSRSLLQVR